MGKLMVGKITAIMRALFGVFVFIALMNMIFTLFVSTGIDYEVYKGTYNFVYGIIVILALLFYMRMTEGANIEDKRLSLLKRERIDVVQVFLIIVISIGLLGIVNLYMTIIATIAEKNKEVATVMEDYAQSTDRYNAIVDIKVIPNFDHVLNLLAVTFLIPLAEEIVFRAIVFGELRKKLHPITSLIISSAIFGYLHGNGLHIIYAFVCGLVLGLVYWFCDSIWASYMVHAIFNFLGSGIFVFIQSGIFGEVSAFENVLNRTLFFTEYMMMLPSLACIVLLGYHYTQKRKQSNSEVVQSDVEQA